VKKKPIKPIKILKNRLVRFDFGFISLKLKKPNQTQAEKKPSQTEKKLSQTGKNRAKPS
jgi:hypothetical protein